MRNVIRRREIKNEKFIDLDFEAPIEELREVLLLGGIMGKILQDNELPETKEFEVFTDFLFFSKRLSDAVPMEKIYIQDEEKENVYELLQVTVSVTKREIKAALEVCEQGMDIIPGFENFTDRDANAAIALDRFRERLMKAAGIKKKGKEDRKIDKIRWQIEEERLRKEDEKFIELNFEASAEELKELSTLEEVLRTTYQKLVGPNTRLMYTIKAGKYEKFENFEFFCSRIREAVKNKYGKQPEQETIQVTITPTEEEIKATVEVLSGVMPFTARDENMTDEQANKAILIESIRRRILKAAGMMN